MPTLNIHDRLFKANLSNVTIARDFFRAHLPTSILETVDLPTLALCNPNFLGKQFKQRFTDILYTAQIDGQQGYLYLATEHQSTPERFMPLRVLHYQTHILLQHLDQSGTLETLPLVYGLVFYHGEPAPYPYTTQLKDCFASPELARQTLLKGFHLVDITQLSDAEIQRHHSVSVMEMLQKHYRSKNLLEVAKLMKPSLQALLAMDLHDTLRYNIEYLLTFLEEDAAEQALEALLLDCPESLKGEIMSVAEQLKQQGMQQGIQQGAKQERATLAKKMLAAGQDVVFVAQMTGLSLEQLKTL